MDDMTRAQVTGSNSTRAEQSNVGGSYAAENFYKHQWEVANKEKAHLQERLRAVENQNKLLLKSLFELSCASTASASVSKTTSAVHDLPFDVVSALRNFSTSTTLPASSTAGKGSASRRSAGMPTASMTNMPAFLNRTGGLQPNVSHAYTPFRHRADLKGHSAAVYAIQFSPNGRLLVSVSFDRSVRFWPIGRLHTRASKDADLSIGDAHRGPIVAVEWVVDSARVVTGSLDQSVAEWDVESASNDPVRRFSCAGLVNSVSMSPADPNIFFVSSTRKQVIMYDRRAAHVSSSTTDAASVVLDNDTIVNTVHVTMDGVRLITGDHGGAIKAWDLREGRGATTSLSDNGLASTTQTIAVGMKYNDENKRPITHIHTSPPLVGETHGRFMAVNSYDAFLRVYDRGSVILPSAEPEVTAVHALRGVVNAHWPIKSSFFLGADYVPPKASRRVKARSRWRDRGSESRSTKSDRAMDDDHDRASSNEDSDDDEVHTSSTSEEDVSEPVDANDAGTLPPTSRPQDAAPGAVIGGAIQAALILASGSADGRVYVFDVGGRRGRGGLLQTLDGHKDRVYAADFHPYEPILASCSADCGIKIWQAR